MHTGKKSVRVQAGKWFGPGAALRVIEFSRAPSDRRRYVRIGTLRPEGWVTIVFFRHDDGSWNVFPPKTDMLGMRACQLAA
ncbi:MULTISPECIES: hypothetical protein [unclassified Cupriavidus]|uniref:hypothetical protein n=1 Tax=unclassified Cupriavidus TaxID=2640874 RepID=UPI00226F71A2|nr:hypothetical protein [Cupriavidus sp. D39]MCY0852911.1 hypothetical protein [Cupriavidus sp. D39]